MASHHEFSTRASGQTSDPIRMVIDGSGNVGIRTASPSYDLDVDGNINFTGNLTKGGSPFGGSSPWTTSGSNIYRSSGNVGIGTTSPGDLFTVGNNSSSDTGGTTSMSILAPGENADAIIYFGTQHNSDSSYSKKAAIIAEGVSTYSRSKLHFCLENTANNTSGSASLSHSRMAILNNGNVGIGTTTPSDRLTISGGALKVITPDPTTNFKVIDFRNPTFGIYALSNTVSAVGNTLEFNADDYNGGSTTTRDVLTLHPAGNVGIGDTTPSYKLDVNGTGRFT